MNFDNQIALVRDMTELRSRPIVVASHPRSGTHLMIDSLRLNFPDCRAWKYWGEVPTCLFVDLDRMIMLDSQLPVSSVARPIRRGTKRPVIKTHALPDFGYIHWAGRQVPFDRSVARWLRENASFIYIYRDVRDVLASAFALFDCENRGVTMRAFMLEPGDRCENRIQAWVTHVTAWLNEPLAVPVAMERLLADPCAVMDRLAAAFTLRTDSTVKLPRPREYFALSKFARALSINLESTALYNPRQGRRKTDWRDLMTLEDRALIHQIAGKMLIELGYEANDCWVGGAPSARVTTRRPMLQATLSHVDRPRPRLAETPADSQR